MEAQIKIIVYVMLYISSKISYIQGRRQAYYNPRQNTNDVQGKLTEMAEKTGVNSN